MRNLLLLRTTTVASHHCLNPSITARFATMTSAASFYNFEPVDSTFFYLCLPLSYL
jgi:hypothetical protein